MMNPECLFVYGTLMPGEVNHHYLQSIKGVWQRASIKGRLYPDGMGLASGYPVLVPDENVAAVDGWLLSADALPEHWPVLDAFEGIAYRRVLMPVNTADNTVTQAYIYLLNEDVQQ